MLIRVKTYSMNSARGPEARARFIEDGKYYELCAYQFVKGWRPQVLFDSDKNSMRALVGYMKTVKKEDSRNALFWPALEILPPGQTDDDLGGFLSTILNEKGELRYTNSSSYQQLKLSSPAQRRVSRAALHQMLTRYNAAKGVNFEGLPVKRAHKDPCDHCGIQFIAPFSTGTDYGVIPDFYYVNPPYDKQARNRPGDALKRTKCCENCMKDEVGAWESSLSSSSNAGEDKESHLPVERFIASDDNAEDDFDDIFG